MQKGQISLDLALALIVVTVFLNAIAVTNSNLEKNTDEMAKSNSAKQMVINFYSAVTTVKAYDINIDLNVQTPLERSKNTIKECKITVDNDGKEISAIIDGINYTYTEINFDNTYIDLQNEQGVSYWSSGYQNNPKKAEIQCGQTVKIKERGPV